VATLDRIASYAAQADGLSFEVTHSLVAGAIDFILCIRQNPLMGGRRAVTEVLEVTGFDGERVTRSHIFVPDPVTGRAVRDTDVAIREDRVKRLADAGYNDTAWYGSYR
jgi:Flp pilus assembly CpaF family ATPase